MDPRPRPPAILLIFGGGGHQEQMKRLYANLLGTRLSEFHFIALAERGASVPGLEASFQIPPIRDKFSTMKSFIFFPWNFVLGCAQSFRILLRFKVVAVISTGPGITIVPSLIFRAFGAKIVFLESWSRFETRSVSGKVMSHIAHLFIVQHPSLKALYPSAEYGGLL